MKRNKMTPSCRESLAKAWDAVTNPDKRQTHLWTIQEAWLDRCRFVVHLKEGITPEQAKERLQKAYMYCDIIFFVVDGRLEKETMFSIGD